MPAVFVEMKSQTKQSIQGVAEAIRMEMTVNGKFDFICKKDKGHVIVLMMEYSGLGYAFFNKYSTLTIVLSQSDEGLIAEMIGSGAEWNIYRLQDHLNNGVIDKAKQSLKKLGFE